MKKPDIEDFKFTKESFFRARAAQEKFENISKLMNIPSTMVGVIIFSYLIIVLTNSIELLYISAVMGFILGPFVSEWVIKLFIPFYNFNDSEKLFHYRDAMRKYENFLIMEKESKYLLEEQLIYHKKVRQEEVKFLRERRLKKKWIEEQKRYLDYWNNLDPYEFETEVAALYESLKYQVIQTKGSGDGGVDVILRKDGEMTLVQCKRYAKQAGPAPVRELYGVMMSRDADNGILICTGGFSIGAIDFSLGKNIELIDSKELVKLHEESNLPI